VELSDAQLQMQSLNLAQKLDLNMVIANYLRQKESAMTNHTRTDDTTIDMESLITVIFVIVDDWYQEQGVQLLQGKRGCKAIFSDSELISLVLCMDIIPFPSERQFYQFIRANYLSLFPQLIDRSQFNRRARCLRLLIEELRRFWLEQLGATLATKLLLDTKPIPVLGYKRNKKHSDFRGAAAYGVCASRNLKYFGFKLVALTTLDGIPVVYELVPANTDERIAAEEVLDFVGNCDIFGDKGFLGEEWKLDQAERQGNRIWTAKRANQSRQNSPEYDRWLNSIRERIEGVFNEVQNVGRNIERLMAKTVIGLCTRIIAKMTNHALKAILRRFFNIDIISFSYIEA
jgi:hypothetical protein